MAVTLANGTPKMFGRGAMTRTAQTIKTHNVIKGSQDYQVTSRTELDRYDSVSYTVPFLVTVGDKKAVMVIENGEYLYFYIKGMNVNEPRYSNISESTSSSRITGFSENPSEYQLYLTLPTFWATDDSKYEANDYLRTYYYESADLVVVRYEQYNDTWEIWVTPDGYIQFIGDSNYSTTGSITTHFPPTYVKLADIKCSDVDSDGKCICPYRVATKAESSITVSGTVTNSSATMTIYCETSGDLPKVQLNVGMTALEVANAFKNNLPSNVTSIFTTTVTDNGDGTATIKSIASKADWNYVPHFYIYSGYGISYTEDKLEYGSRAITCNYYSTSRSKCYYNGYTTQYQSTDSVKQYTFNGTKKPSLLFKLGSDGVVTPYENQYIQNPVSTLVSNLITIKRGNKQVDGYSRTLTREGVFLYSRPLTASELGVSSVKVLSFNVGGEVLYAHLTPVGSVPTNAEVIDMMRLSYGGENLEALNYAIKAKSIQAMPVIDDKEYNTCYWSTGSTSYYWNYTQIYGFHTPIANVSEIRCKFYSDTGENSYTPLPNDSYPNLYFCYRTSYDNTSSSSSWSGVQNITLPTPVYNNPHLVVFKFSSPITIAQWCIIPRALGGNYSTNCSYGFSDFNIVTNDNKSLNFKI